MILAVTVKGRKKGNVKSVVNAVEFLRHMVCWLINIELV